MLSLLLLCAEVPLQEETSFSEILVSRYFVEMLYCSICVFDQKQVSPEERVAELFLCCRNLQPWSSHPGLTCLVPITIYGPTWKLGIRLWLLPLASLLVICRNDHVLYSFRSKAGWSPRRRACWPSLLPDNVWPGGEICEVAQSQMCGPNLAVPGFTHRHRSFSL